MIIDYKTWITKILLTRTSNYKNMDSSPQYLIYLFLKYKILSINLL